MSGSISANEVQVAIVGFGPSGAVAASLLGAQGIRTLAVDRDRAVYDKPRAIALDHEILRLFDNLGIAGQMRPHIAPFPASEHFGARGQLIRRIDMVSEPYPLGYTPTMVFTQPPVEEILRAHARSYPSVAVELGTELRSLSQAPDGVTLELSSDRGTRKVTADYVIACDGASSSVRRQLGIGFDDLVFDEPWLVVDLRVNASRIAKLPRTAAQFCDPARPTTYIVGPGAHRRFEIMLSPGEDPRAMEQPDQVWRLLARWLTPDDATLWRAASYRFHALVASKWREGRVFLAGDAAHQQPPFIGQGMCQGVRDVANLVWKLGRVLRGESGAALLDTYQDERSAHVRELTTRIKAIGHVICERDPDAAAARDARILAEGGGAPRTITRQEIVPPLSCGLRADMAHAVNGTLFPQPWILTSGGRQLLDAACGAGWRLVLKGDSALTRSSAIAARATEMGLRLIAIATADHDQGPDVLREESGVVTHWFGRHACTAAIVRPDHYVYGVAADEPGLTAMLSGLEVRLQ
ncbi:bifunctional 3-(3-hydroxy-phenyl)propionate/3-hydroxycinnamic acid hydroxylase [uncultured Bradyrhizobium sp.]|uniref:bifunctional 3-(3-hydroxy-phenyl)propionate/3-hydroxycinnamic acid hydroxylase n=1 Tax=uncultured Bradyrhizobium sp. TaxID=199684 RepID=UPI002626C4ED|nr:bifunctional 3-(3-hydroxy-phenyl)propionate/3-hydroxycinnamic acid hydroxylase [uncultured Bradyrhizobium sp.]